MMKNELAKTRLPLLALFLTLGLNFAQARTWYVNGTSGNDSNSCTSAGAACRTIKHKLRAIQLWSPRGLTERILVLGSA